MGEDTQGSRLAATPGRRSAAPRAQKSGSAGEKRLVLPRLSQEADAQYTTLFSGYSMIPSAPSALSCGMISRTTRSSMIVSTAIQPGCVR